MNKKNYPIIFLLVLLGFSLAVPAYADNGRNQLKGERERGDKKEFNDSDRPVVFGTVTSINGSTITVAGRQGFGTTTSNTISYTVDGSGASVLKNGQETSISAIVVNDSVFVQGTISGTNVIAKIIHDGPTAKRNNKQEENRKNNTGKNITIEGDGQPVILGTVMLINGNTVTIKNKGVNQYSIDISGAKIIKNNNQITASAISVGDSLAIQGSVSGTSVTATTIIVNSAPVGGQASTTPKIGGFFRSVGSFFSRLFGF